MTQQIKNPKTYVGKKNLNENLGKKELAATARQRLLGPCFGTTGHFRRDPDVISRLPDTTTQDLSVFICFRC